MPKRGKKYLEAAQKIDRERLYPPSEAMELAQETSYAGFDASVDLHIRLRVDPRHADQQVRGVVRLPHGLGKDVRVLVFAGADGARFAQDAGADHVIVDDDELKRIQDGWTEFDVAIAVPEMMGKVGRLGRVLGPRGLMPNPRTGTVVPAEDLPRVVEEAKAGRAEFRVDKTGNVHVPIGRASFPKDKLLGNMAAVMEEIVKSRPASVKGIYIRKVTLAASMGPGIKVDPMQAQALEASL